MTPMQKKIGLYPMGRAVLCEIYDPEVKKSVIAIPQAVKERHAMIETRMRVLEVGPACWDDEKAPRCYPGDIVIVSKFCGATVKSPINQKTYRMVNCDDIYCGSTEDAVAHAESYETGSVTAREA